MSAFPLFQKLPKELRTAIWKAALLSPLGPALLPFIEGHGHMPQTQEELGPDNLYWIWDHKHLPDRIISASLAAVNTEARTIMLDWLRKQPVTLRPRGPITQPTYLGGFNPSIDAIYLPQSRLKDFYDDCRGPYGNLITRQTISSSLRHLAIPVTMLRDYLAMQGLFVSFCDVHIGLGSLLIVMNPPTEDDAALDTRRQLGYENLRQGTYTRYAGSTTSWSFVQGEVDIDPELHGLIIAVLDDGLVMTGYLHDHPCDLEIRAVFAHERQ